MLREPLVMNVEKKVEMKVVNNWSKRIVGPLVVEHAVVVVVALAGGCCSFRKKECGCACEYIGVVGSVKFRSLLGIRFSWSNDWNSRSTTMADLSQSRPRLL
jgi:hypothetical protein